MCPQSTADHRGGGVAAGDGGEMVLVVDDSEVLLFLARRALELEGLEVATANGGAAALSVLEDQGERVGAVILDMSMPGMNGLAAFDAMQSLRPGVRVILTSGWDEDEVQRMFEGRPLAGYIRKPYGASVLVDLVRKVLRTE